MLFTSYMPLMPRMRWTLSGCRRPKQAGVDMVGEPLVHVPVAPLVAAAERGGKDQHPRAPVAEDLEVHLAAERRRHPAVMLVLHESPGLRSYPLPRRNGNASRKRRPQARSWCPAPASSTYDRSRPIT